jgi:hypothetical protein
MLERVEGPLTSDSIVRLLRTTGSTRAQKSKTSTNGPAALRSATMRSTRLSPTLRTAARPKTIDFPSSTLRSGANSATERFTSGTSTSMPMERHSARYTAVLSLLSLTDVSNADMYSTG